MDINQHLLCIGEETQFVENVVEWEPSITMRNAFVGKEQKLSMIFARLEKYKKISEFNKNKFIIIL